MPDRPLVVAIFTGGTIAMLPDPRSGAAVPALRGAEVLARLPAAPAAEVETVDWGLVPASHLRFGQILDISRLIAAAAARPDVSGIVVVQGTDVLEETAFAWDLLHGGDGGDGGDGGHGRDAGDVPVVVVGAMRNAGEPDADGPRNLTDAIAVASEPRLHGQGVVAAMAGLVLPADDVVKTHTSALDTFQAPNTGALARIVAGRVEVLRERGPRRRIEGAVDRAVDGVALLTAVVSTDGELLRAAVERGAPGIVVEATGAGNTDADLLEAARAAMSAGIPVVLATRCASGGVEPAYGFPGGGRTWLDAGAILAGTLSGPKARVALAIGLGAGLDRDGLARLIAGDDASG